MAKEISLFDIKSYFQGRASSKKKLEIEDERRKALSFLRNKFSSISDDDIEDIYQESLSALYLNIESGKLSELTCPFSTYFLQICNNQALKFVRKLKNMPDMLREKQITNPNIIRDDKVDDLYGFCMDTEEENRKIRMELLVNNIIASMTDTCKNILHGYYWNDFSTSTIADIFGFSDANSVKAQKYKCVKKFRDKYNELKNKIYG